MNILITGGTGYIGSHMAVLLAQAGNQVVLLDNLCNSSPTTVKKIREMTGKDISLLAVDLRDQEALQDALAPLELDGVIHFAGLKAVAESVAKPDLYYENNVGGTRNLLKAMAAKNIHRLVFSSSATVYGIPDRNPIPETAAIRPINPYGETKAEIERMLEEKSKEDPRWQITILRYFNPIGAWPGGAIGEDPKGIPNNLMPYLTQVATGTLPELQIFGQDYDTKDGTGVRDYIHVMDLVRGHMAALEHIQRGIMTYNLGTGKGTSVLELVQTFEETCGIRIPVRMTERRPGDLDCCLADPGKANQILGWKARHSLQEMCRDAWDYQRMNDKKEEGTEVLLGKR